MQKRVWFNQGMPLLEEVFEVVKAVGDSSIFIICSHRLLDFPAGRKCDLFVKEPDNLSDADYLEYCLRFAEEHHVDLFVPSSRAPLLVANRERFSSIDVKLMVAGEADVLEMIRSKTECYEALGAGLVPMPEYRVFSDLAGFEAAYAAMAPRHDKVCFKPVAGVFAHGFRVVVPDGGAFDRLMDTGPYTATTSVGLSEARIIFGERESFEPFMLMEYLEGRERSVDCIAEKGKLVRSIIRLKDTHSTQLMEANPHVDELIDRIVGKLKLDGVFNVQFKDHNGEPYLLEINSRMSGGLHKACMATQFPMPYWALRLALGTVAASEIPYPKTGVRLRKRKSYEME
ncbi:MAG: ATP-grasp domain-containing protein [Candidatus Obscuribacter sp.]|nr:ATP-grasp domain-containing protein [Candidatus Obscuribacter sp.]